MDESELEARASITAVDGDATALLNTRQSAERTSKLNSLKERRRAATPPDTRALAPEEAVEHIPAAHGSEGSTPHAKHVSSAPASEMVASEATVTPLAATAAAAAAAPPTELTPQQRAAALASADLPEPCPQATSSEASSSNRPPASARRTAEPTAAAAGVGTAGLPAPDSSSRVRKPGQGSRLPAPEGVRAPRQPRSSALPSAPIAAAGPALSSLSGPASPHRSPHRSPDRGGSPGRDGAWNVYGREASGPRAVPQLQGPTEEERAVRRARFAERRLREEARLKAQLARTAAEEATKKAAEEARLEARRAALRERIARQHQAVAAEAAERAAAEERARQEVLKFKGKPLHEKLEEEYEKVQKAEEQERKTRYEQTTAQRHVRPAQIISGQVVIKPLPGATPVAATPPGGPSSHQGGQRTSPHRHRSPGPSRPEPRRTSGTGAKHNHHSTTSTATPAAHQSNRAEADVAEQVDEEEPLPFGVPSGGAAAPNNAKSDKPRTKGVMLYSTRAKATGPPVPPVPAPPHPLLVAVDSVQSHGSGQTTQPGGQPLLATGHTGPLQPSLRSRRNSGVSSTAAQAFDPNNADHNAALIRQVVSQAACAPAVHLDDDDVVLASGSGSHDGSATQASPVAEVPEVVSEVVGSDAAASGAGGERAVEVELAHVEPEDARVGQEGAEHAVSPGSSTSKAQEPPEVTAVEADHDGVHTTAASEVSALDSEPASGSAETVTAGEGELVKVDQAAPAAVADADGGPLAAPEPSGVAAAAAAAAGGVHQDAAGAYKEGPAGEPDAGLAGGVAAAAAAQPDAKPEETAEPGTEPAAELEGASDSTSTEPHGEPTSGAAPSAMPDAGVALAAGPAAEVDAEPQSPATPGPAAAAAEEEAAEEGPASVVTAVAGPEDALEPGELPAVGDSCGSASEQPISLAPV
ncbi:hypothetical protein V8C86DRAFT_2734388 [Haematococcus lacustris]